MNTADPLDRLVQDALRAVAGEVVAAESPPAAASGGSVPMASDQPPAVAGRRHGAGPPQPAGLPAAGPQPSQPLAPGLPPLPHLDPRPLGAGARVRADAVERLLSAAMQPVGAIQGIPSSPLSLAELPAPADVAPSAPAAPMAAPEAFGRGDQVPAAASPYILAPTGTAGAGVNDPDPPDLHPHRRDFPILNQTINGHRLVWLDSGATTQKPRVVIEALARHYSENNSNIHRSAHTLARRSSEAYDRARSTVRRFLGARSDSEIVFVRGCTEAINLVAQSWGTAHVRAGDEILVSELEHHANIVPWQMLCQRSGARLVVAPVDGAGDLDMDAYARLLNPRTRLVALTQVANITGTVVPVTPLIAMAHRVGALALVDGAQSVAHMPLDVACMDADFFVFSGHKVFGPTGIGVLYGKQAILEGMPPWQGGGNMIEQVSFERTTYQPPPARFEAGTAPIAGAIGLGVALEYVERIGRLQIASAEHQLIRYAEQELLTIPGLRIIGRPSLRAGAVPFKLAEHEDAAVARHLDGEGIALRAGHHCAQPILRRFGLTSAVRPSFALYNGPDDVDALVASLRRLVLR